MLKANMMNILLATVGVMAVLVGYNAFAVTHEDGHTATDHASEYLGLVIIKPEESTDPALAGLSVDDAKTIVGDAKDKLDDTTKKDEPVKTEAQPSDQSQPQATPEAITQTTPETTATPITTTAQAGDKAEVIYTVKEGDTYGCIAEKYYGSFEHWVDIMNVNPVGTIGFTEYGLFVGAQIVLPAISQANLKPVSNLCS